jgi:AcrR family transcriptional regulator
VADHGDRVLTPGIVATWGEGAREPRGRRRLSLTRIVEAGVALATRDGLASVSMGRLAAELGTAPMSLYRHVADKQELLALMVDAAAGPAPDIPEPGDDWRSATTRWTRAFRLAAMRYPWAVQVPLNGPPLTPHLVGWMEHGLRCLSGTGLAPAEQLSILRLLMGYVRDDIATSTELEAARNASGTSGILSAYREALVSVIEPDAFPALSALIGSGALDHDDDPEVEFTFGLERIVDGIERLVETRGSVM